tara:strand:- start:122 stop:700 length:579 start_codon:yes stop_codon:yes gene_type:complete
MKDKIPRKNHKVGNVLDDIVELETDMFLRIKPLYPAQCQEHPDEFRRWRRANYAPLSETTKRLYLEDLVAADNAGENLVAEKYIGMAQNPPGAARAQVVGEIHSQLVEWLVEVMKRHPKIFGAKSIDYSANYLRSELETMSSATLNSYRSDVQRAREEGRNIPAETYDHMANQLGFNSLTDLEYGTRNVKSH